MQRYVLVAFNGISYMRALRKSYNIFEHIEFDIYFILWPFIIINRLDKWLNSMVRVRIVEILEKVVLKKKIYKFEQSGSPWATFIVAMLQMSAEKFFSHFCFSTAYYYSLYYICWSLNVTNIENKKSNI